MANLHPQKKDNPKLSQKPLADGRLSLYLEYYLGYTKIYNETSNKWQIKHKRKKESLELYLLNKPRTSQEKEYNREMLERANFIRSKREDEIKSKKFNIEDKNKAKINFIDYCDRFLANYINKDVRIVKYCIKYFKEFIKLELGNDYLLPVDVKEKLAIKFKAYLESKLNGETPHDYFTKFKKICKEAYNEGLPLDRKVLEVKNMRNEGLKKEILSFDEIQKLASTELSNQNVKRAFLFCLFTGLRFCDVKALQWHNISNDQIIIRSQQKTGKPVYIDLSTTAKTLIKARGKADELVFNLPSLTGSLKLLKTWAKNAKIDKNITWHSSRHSFAVNLLINHNDIKTVSSLLGHAGLKHTEKYTRVVNELMKKAVNSLPEITL